MRCLSIDHGKHSGWALLEDGYYVASGRFTLNSTSQGERSWLLYNEALELMNEYKPDWIALERPVDKLNGSTTEVLIGYYNTLLMACHTMKLNNIGIIPTSMKKKLTGDGRAHKDKVADWVAKKFNIDKDIIAPPIYYKSKNFIKQGKLIKDRVFDESDAIALAYFAWLEVLENAV